MTQLTQLACACGKVQIEVVDAPIINAECHCNSCRAFGRKMQPRGESPPFLEANGGTRFNLYRKDRIRFLKGSDLLGDVRQAHDAKTRRVIATCCNAPVYLEFPHAHWLNLYGGLWPKGTQPALKLRTMTSDLADISSLPDDVPNKKRQSVAFFAKLFGAWIAMGFKTPNLPPADGEVHV